MPVAIGAVPGPALKCTSNALYALCKLSSALCKAVFPLEQASLNFLKKSPTSTADFVGRPFESLPSPGPTNRAALEEARPMDLATEPSLDSKAEAKRSKNMFNLVSKAAYLLRSVRANVFGTSCPRGLPWSDPVNVSIMSLPRSSTVSYLPNPICGFGASIPSAAYAHPCAGCVDSEAKR